MQFWLIKRTLEKKIIVRIDNIILLGREKIINSHIFFIKYKFIYFSSIIQIGINIFFFKKQIGINISGGYIGSYIILKGIQV